jgi:hypothetical protein
MKTNGGITAVIVGIDGYKDKPPLNCAVNDAVYLEETLKKVWQDREVNIQTLVWPSFNEEKSKSQREAWGIDLPRDASPVTRENILTKIRESAEAAKESHIFLFYFSGHGELNQHVPTLFTIEDSSTAEGIAKITIEEIQQAAANCRAGHKIMILDCCQTYSQKKKYAAAENHTRMHELANNWSILISSSPGEYSREDHYRGEDSDDYLQQGIFTASLVEGLRGEAAPDNDSVSLADLAYFVGKRVPLEYGERERIKVEKILAQNKGGKKGKKGAGWERPVTQNPVLLSAAVAMDGPLKIIMAPRIVPTAQRSRSSTPGPHFIKNWAKFLAAKWPLAFPYRWAFGLGAFFYSLAIVLTVLWHTPDVSNLDNTMMLYSGVLAAGSVLTWFLAISFAIAVNEARWHIGGYLTALFFMSWHCIVAFSFAWICGIESAVNQEPSRFIYLLTDLFFIFAGIMIFGTNTGQTVIALAELIRTDERREIRQAIRVFQQFKYKKLGVDLYNYLPAFAIRPDLYLLFWLIAMAIVGYNFYQVLPSAGAVTMRTWIFLTRNIVLMIMVSWLMFWYHSAFKFIQREIYKR